MEQRKCPECDSVATEKFEGWDEWIWSPPECPNGHGLITEEGLLLTSSGEVGKGGLVISYGDSPASCFATLLETISRLDRPDPSGNEVLDFARASDKRWNRKRAKRRFHRWLRETDNNLPPITDPRLRECAKRLTEDARSQVEASTCWTMEDLERWGRSGFLQELTDYESRRDAEEPILLLADDLPERIGQAFKQ